MTGAWIFSVRARWALGFALLALLVLPLAARADNTIADGDGVAPVTNHNISLGDVCQGVTVNTPVLIAIRRAGAGGPNIFANSSTATISVFSTSGAGVSAAMGSPATIALPSTWTGSSTGTMSSAVSSTVTFSSSTLGTIVGSVTYRASGTNTSSSPLTRDDSIAVTGTVVDCVAPVSTISLTPAAPNGSNGWYTSAVTVAVSAVDNAGGSGVAETRCVLDPVSVPLTFDALPAGCAYTGAGLPVAGNGQHTFYAASSDVAGNKEAVKSAAFKIDTVAPAVSETGNACATPGTAGWCRGPVAVTFTASDATSGVATPCSGASCSFIQSTSGDGSAVKASSGPVTDAAGNSNPGILSAGYMVDATTPTISGSGAPAANGYGWNNTDVTVSFTCGDATSGIGSCTAPVILSSEGAGQSVAGTAVDNAGNSAGTTVGPINIDKTLPTISGSAAPAPNGNGWNNTNVTVTFTCGDALSGIASCTAPVTLSSEGAGQSAAGTAVDKAGNSASATVSGINIDKTAPTVAVTGVANGATYVLGSVPVAGCSTSDALSGVATSATLSSSGGPVGSFTATCSGATDKAGNATAPVSVTYTVIYNWKGFFQPVANPSVVNVVNAGSGVPLKFSLTGYQGMAILAAGSPSVQPSSCSGGPTSDLAAATSGNSSLNYDASSDQYIFVWKTEKAWAGQCATLSLKLIDGTTHTALFRFK